AKNFFARLGRWRLQLKREDEPMNPTLLPPTRAIAAEPIHYRSDRKNPALAAGLLGLLLAAGVAVGAGIWFLFNLRPATEPGPAPFAPKLDMADSRIQ